jgi:ABC-type transporter Mla maintaining outer membrane lipid asymmetry permease subunit MlaE
MCGYMCHATTQCCMGLALGLCSSSNGMDSIESSESVSGVMNKDESIVNASIVVRMCESENDSVSG